MQSYSGPSQRVLSRHKGNGLLVDGRRNHIQERLIYMKQDFKLTQSNDTTTQLNDYWVFPEEREQLNEDAQKAFTNKKDITDRMLINKSIQKSVFKPDNAQNYASIRTKVKQRLAPYLCSDLEYNNTTREPIVTHTTSRSKHSARCLWAFLLLSG